MKTKGGKSSFSFSNGNIEKLSKTIFNLNENIDKNIQDCNLDDLIKEIKERENSEITSSSSPTTIINNDLSAHELTTSSSSPFLIYDTSKTNVFKFPTVIRRIYDTYCDNRHSTFTVFGPNQLVNLNLLTIEDKETLFFLLKVNKEDPNSVKYTRDVLEFKCIVEKLNLPTFYKLITEDGYIGINKVFSKGLTVTSNNDYKSILKPVQYVKGKGMSDEVVKNNNNRIIICVRF